jgi:membrane associated rhomboid family serine protease
MIPIGTDTPARRTPWMNWFLILTCVAVYLVSNSAPLSTQPAPLAPGWGRLVLNPTHLRLYQFITYLFLHADLWHIGGNMLFLWVFGNLMNEKLGSWPYLFFFLASGILAGCGQVLSGWAPTIGASGAIAAVAGLFLVLAPLTNIRVWFFFIFDVPSVLFVLFQIIVFDILGQYTQGAGAIAHWAHLTGYAVGITTGLILLATRLVPRDHYDLLALLNRWRRRRAYQGMVAKGYNPFSSVPAPGALTAAAGAAPQVIKVMPLPDPRVLQLRDEIVRLRRNHQLAAAAAIYLQLRQLDPRFVLSAEVQLDISNQLMSEGRHRQAADAYEDYLEHHPTGPDADQVRLMLGLVYTRYYTRPGRALELLQKALQRLHDPRQRALAERELAQLQAAGPSTGPTG